MSTSAGIINSLPDALLWMAVNVMYTEIELKYSLDEAAAREILARQQLGSWRLGPFTTEVVTDVYYDTPDGRVARAGYALRFRQSDAERMLQLKSLTPTAGALHRREEVHLPTTAPTSPQKWPDGPEKRLLLAILDKRPLVPLFSIRQRRHVAPVLDESGRSFALLTLDEVRWRAGEQERRAWELEVELLPQGDESRLQALARELSTFSGLRPQPMSKYQRGRLLLSSVEDGG